MAKKIKILITLALPLLIILVYLFLIKPAPVKDQLINNYSNNMFKIDSVFLNGGQIPDKYGCHDQSVNPPLNFFDIPKGTQSLALIVDDPDAPSGDWVHWLVFNLDPRLIGINENSIPAGAIAGRNSFGNNSYDGPCPPSGTHRYYFKLYALDTILNISPTTEKSDLLSAMTSHILGQAELMGIYSK